jgi:hypothetical protein
VSGNVADLADFADLVEELAFPGHQDGVTR